MARPRPPRREITADKVDSASRVGRGVLHVVATPIGNLGDLSARAREVLSTCDVIAAEDTRLVAQLLRTTKIAGRLVSAHEHNEEQRVAQLLAALDAGQSAALVSDAGTPLISDPGYRIVRAVASAGHEIRAVPGPCAAIAALSIAGIASDRFVFEGFLVAKSAARRARLAELTADARTLIFYEAPHRLEETLREMGEVLGAQREAVVARELTKAFETAYRGSLGELAQRAQQDPDMKRGEIVIVVAGAAESAPDTDRELSRVLAELLPALPVSQAADIAARITGANRNRAYKLALQSVKA
ncbi:MAG TPA: 16S rRNA (cytidine(1402)-2'-O)-methyltransferase [Steroidobacteraceae bacterium]|nr:16S rRNA (cytidine(1402)-2'-O)-methyltransferase [Steroidobacteraceae bacterium]